MKCKGHGSCICFVWLLKSSTLLTVVSFPRDTFTNYHFKSVSSAQGYNVRSTVPEWDKPSRQTVAEDKEGRVWGMPGTNTE